MSTNTHSTFEEETQEAWAEDKAEDYPVQDFDDTAAEDDPANSAGFIGGVADQRTKPEVYETETTGDKPEPPSDEPEPDAGSSATVTPSAEADDDARDDTIDVDAGLISRTEKAGLSDLSDLSAAQLEKVLAHLERANDRALLRPEPEERAAVSDQPPADEPEEFKLELNPEYQDPEVIKAFTALDQRHQAQNKKLQTQIDDLTGHARSQAQRANQSEFDSWVTSLPKEYAEFLGAGPTSELDEGGDFFRTRNEVAIAAGALEAQIPQNGNTTPNRKAMLKRGLHAILGDKVIQIERAIAKESDSKRRSTTTAVPTHKRERDPQKPLGDRAAHQWAAEWMRAEGLAPAVDEGMPSGSEEGI